MENRRYLCRILSKKIWKYKSIQEFRWIAIILHRRESSISNLLLVRIIKISNFNLVFRIVCWSNIYKAKKHFDFIFKWLRSWLSRCICWCSRKIKRTYSFYGFRHFGWILKNASWLLRDWLFPINKIDWSIRIRFKKICIWWGCLKLIR